MTEFKHEEHYTLEEFCSLTGYQEAFVREVSENCDDFWAYVSDGVLVIPKSAEYHNRFVLNRVYYRFLNNGIL